MGLWIPKGLSQQVRGSINVTGPPHWSKVGIPFFGSTVWWPQRVKLLFPDLFGKGAIQTLADPTFRLLWPGPSGSMPVVKEAEKGPLLRESQLQCPQANNCNRSCPMRRQKSGTHSLSRSPKSPLLKRTHLNWVVQRQSRILVFGLLISGPFPVIFLCRDLWIRIGQPSILNSPAPIGFHCCSINPDFYEWLGKGGIRNN